MDTSSVLRWVKHLQDGNTNIHDQPRSGHPQSESTEQNKQRVDEIIKDDRCLTVNDIARILGVGLRAVQEIVPRLTRRKTRKSSLKQSLPRFFSDIRVKEKIFCLVLLRVTKAGFTISSLKQNGKAWDGTIGTHHRRRKQGLCPQLRRLWAQSSRMQKGGFWQTSWNREKL